MARGMKTMVFAFTSLLSGMTLAQLADPTRPLLDTTLSGDALPGISAPAASGLQSVILRKQGKPAALINGEVVELGGKVGEARLVKVSEDAVVLRGPGGEETLRLIPTAEKKLAAGVTVKSAASRAINKDAKRMETGR